MHYIIELQKILNNFTRSTKEIFGYSMLADTDTRVITITKDDSNRDFAAMSWSEKYFIDVVFRLAIFNFLIETGIPILSEEGREIPFEERSSWEYLWIVDPLDGTKEFVKRNGEFTVNIALIKNGVPILGVIYVPVKE